jgi:hypothetical protein
MTCSRDLPFVDFLVVDLVFLPSLKAEQSKHLVVISAKVMLPILEFDIFSGPLIPKI